jgi:hypothetical protein
MVVEGMVVEDAEGNNFKGMIDISQHTPNGLSQKHLIPFCNYHFERYFLLHLQQ